MKKILLSVIAIVGFALTTSAQTIDTILALDGTYKKQLQTIYITEDRSVHFVSPEPIQYVDISTHHIIGDLPVKNVLRIKAVKDSLAKIEFGMYARDVGIITIVGEKFMAQYNVQYVEKDSHVNFQTSIHIQPSSMQALDNPTIGFSQPELKQFAESILKKKRQFHSVSSKAYGLNADLNNIYTIGDYVFLDIAYTNSTNLKYDVDQIRFKIDDKKIVKATNVQSVEVEPVFQLYKNNTFKKSFRNVYVFKKFTFPGNKVLNIEMTELQISGRLINLQLDYSDLLNADTL